MDLRSEAEGHHRSAGYDAERDEAVDARVIPIGDERGTRELVASAQTHPRSYLVADKADMPAAARTQRCVRCWGCSNR